MDVTGVSSTATQHLPDCPGSLLNAWKTSPNKRCRSLGILSRMIAADGAQIYSELSPQRPSVEKQVSPIVQSPPSIVAYQSPPPPQPQALPDITPMRRGRPTKDSPVVHSPATSRTRAADPSPRIRPISTDPFSALDQNTVSLNPDDLASRFPSVEQFSILHDSGNKFEFGEGLSPSMPDPGKKDLKTRLTEKLADDAFASTSPPPAQKAPADPKQYQSISRPVTGHGVTAWPVLLEPQPTRPVMVSTGTMTSPESSSSRSPSPRDYPMVRSKTQELAFESQGSAPVTSRLKQQRPATLLDVGRSATHTPTMTRTPSSSRPSLEYSRSASTLEAGNPNPPPRSASVNSKPRPTSVYIESNLDFLRDLDSATTQGTGNMPPPSGTFSIQKTTTGQSISSNYVNIESNVDYLRSMEQESDVKPEKRSMGGNFVAKHVKRASMPSISLPGTKSLLAGKFGDAFRRFERNNTGGSAHDQTQERVPSPERSVMPVITGSQNTSDLDDDWEVSSQDVPPEMKRELEKRRLSQEERRVAAAAAEYKRQLAERDAVGGRPPTASSRNRANSIQNKVKALLSENRVPAPKTAEGYGRFTDIPQKQQQPVDIKSRTSPTEKPQIDGYIQSHHRGSVSYRAAPTDPMITIASSRKAAPAPMTLPSALTGSGQPSPRPPPPPKPNKLRIGGTGGGTGGGVSSTAVPSPPTRTVANGGVTEDGVNVSDEDWQKNFAKRYPSLSGLEMVETVVSPGRKV